MATISREVRDALHREIVLSLSGLDDLRKCIELGRGDQAREYRARFEDSFAILDDLGWDALDLRESYELSASDPLRRSLRYLESALRGSLRDMVRDRKEPPDAWPDLGDYEDAQVEIRCNVDRDLDTYAAVRRLLAEVS